MYYTIFCPTLNKDFNNNNNNNNNSNNNKYNNNNNDIAKNILNVVHEEKSRMKVFRQKQLISKDISFHAPIKKSNYK